MKQIKIENWFGKLVPEKSKEEKITNCLDLISEVG